MILVAYSAPFAVFRDFSAGYFRPSFPFAPPSAVYGLLLNLAGIEMRGELGPGTTETRAGLPRFRVASAASSAAHSKHSFAVSADQRRMPGRAVLFQQLHTIPVGSSSKERKPLTKGNKHHIAPARRELLTTFRGICAVDATAEFEERLVAQIADPDPLQENGQQRYGVPFLGDNNFFLEELAIAQPDETPVDWLVVSSEPEEEDDLLGGNSSGSPEDTFPFRLTLWADRTGMKGTRDAMFATRPGTLDLIPEEAWVEVGPA